MQKCLLKIREMFDKKYITIKKGLQNAKYYKAKSFFAIAILFLFVFASFGQNISAQNFDDAYSPNDSNQNNFENFNENSNLQINSNTATERENSSSQDDENSNDKEIDNSLSSFRSDIVIFDNDALPWISMQEPKKSDNNRLRISFAEGVNEISFEDKLAIDSMLKLLGDEGEKPSLIIKSFSAKNTDFDDGLAKAILRLNKLIEYLEAKNVILENIKYYSFPKTANDYDLNYIDIDKS